MKYLAGVAAALGLFADCAMAQDRVELAPSSNWIANYDDDSCALQRQFGGEGQQTFLELRQFGGSPDMQVIIASKDFERRTGGFKVAFTPLQPEPLDVLGFDIRLDAEYQGKLFALSLGRDDPRTGAAWREFVRASTIVTDRQRNLLLRAADLQRDSAEWRRLMPDQDYVTAATLVGDAFRYTEFWRSHLERMESEIEGVLIDGAFNRRLFLRTGELHAPMEAMRTCLDELYSHWGIDVEAHKTLTRPALPANYADFARRISRRYPGEMQRVGMQGFLRVRLTVSADGKPTACHMQTPINDKAFEKVACDNLMSHAKFHPALDAQGQPIASYYQTAIIYRLRD